MRIACVHVPQFALQSLTRIDPSLRGAAVAVVGTGVTPGHESGSTVLTADHARRALSTPVVQACSRAAWALGVRLGMTATAANALAPGQLRVVTADAQLERETVRAIADALLSVSGVVDAGGRVGAGGAHLAMYCEVPSKTRGTSYGDRLVETLEALGLTARIGIADDRFTAWVAAQTTERPGDDEHRVVSVPRGGSAAFLAPRPLSLLAISPEVQHMLEALGVRTLGEFAALPAPSVARPVEADYQALARGEGGHDLRPYHPEAPVREDIVLNPGARVVGAEQAPSAASAIATVASRVALRLAGRGRGAARLELTIAGPDGEHVLPAITPLAPSSATALAPTEDGSPRRVLESAEELADAIGHAVGDALATAWRLRVAITGEAIAGDTADADASSAAAGVMGAGAMAAIAASGVTATTAAADARAAATSALSIVLSTTGSGAGSSGSGAWRLTPPATGPTGSSELRNERRDAHRRTRRGKQHRRVRGAEAPIQAWLFAERK